METKKYKLIQRVQLIIIFLNLSVASLKMMFGFLINSAAMTADGLNSMMDGLNNVVGMVGIYFAFQPYDDKHPYGHRKFETLTTFLISGLLIVSSINMLKGAFDRILHPQLVSVSISSFIVMVFTIIVNIFVTKYEKKKGKELQSDFLLSDAIHTLSDVFISISVICTLIAVKLGFIWVDTLASVVIAVLIIKAAVEIILRGADVLCDAMVIDPVKISSVVCSFHEVSSCHKIRSHGRLDDIHIDLHIIVQYAMDLEEVHKLVHKIENAIQKAFLGVTDVSIHVEPPNNIKNVIENR